MHSLTFYFVSVWNMLLLAVCVWFMLRGSSMLRRVLGLEVFTMILTALLVLFALRTGEASYLDTALILALLSFAGTIAAARYASEREMFP